MSSLDDVVILPAKGDENFARNVTKILQMQSDGVSLGTVTSTDFEDSNPYLRIHSEDVDVSGRQAFFLQRYHGDVSRAWIELLLFANAAQQALAAGVHAVETYTGCSRMERISKPGEALAMQAKALSLQSAGLRTCTSFSIHAEAIKGFFDASRCRFDSIPIWPLFVRVVHGLTSDDETVQYVAPDAAAAKPLQHILGCSTVKTHSRYRRQTVIVHKDREHQAASADGVDRTSRSEYIVGSVDGCVAVLTDDEVNSAGTMCDGARLCKDNGATRVILAGAHGKYARDQRGVQKIREAMDAGYIDMFIVTNTGELFPKVREFIDDPAYADKIVVIPTEPLVADIVEGIVTPGQGYSHLFSSKRIVLAYKRVARHLEDLNLKSVSAEDRAEAILFRNQMCAAVLGQYEGPYATSGNRYRRGLEQVAQEPSLTTPGAAVDTAGSSDAPLRD
jgi:ribose-phosphate pyrophosphokinase